MRVKSRAHLAIILTLYLILSLGYGIINPLFEAPDEHSHFFTAQTISETHHLPIVETPPDPWMGQEAAQPPLYYVLGALLISPIDTSTARELVWPNPFVKLGDASWPHNTNAFIHGPAEAWPWQGYVLAAHLLRALSAVFGLGTLICIYVSGRLFFSNRPGIAVLATALVAFIPQFGFLHGTVTNDSLLLFLCTAALGQLIGLWFRSITGMRLFGLGVTVGLAVLTKNAGILLFALSVGVLFLLCLRERRWALCQPIVLLFFVPSLLMAGWLFWRNWTLYGDPTAANQFIEYFGGNRSYTLWEVISSSGGIGPSFIAVFGWFNVRAPSWVFFIWSGILFFALVGIVRYYQKERHRQRPIDPSPDILHRSWFPAVWLALWPVMVVMGLIRFMLETPAAQGRLLFPALLPMALIVAWGLHQWRFKQIGWLATLLALLTSATCLFFVIPNAYAQPEPLSALPGRVERLDRDMGKELVLVGASVETETARPGDLVWLTLYWRASGRLAEAPSFVLVLFGRQTELVGKLQSYHGGGLYPANLWSTGDLMADRIAVKLSTDARVPTRVRLNVAIVDGEGSMDVGTIKVIPHQWPAPPESMVATLGNEIELAEVEYDQIGIAGNTIQLSTQWSVKFKPNGDWTTFIHLGDPTLPPLAQGDSVPLQGDYPTSLWEPGEVMTDSYTLMLPTNIQAGVYPIWLGMYDSSTLKRLPLSIDGERQQNDALLVGSVTVKD